MTFFGPDIRNGLPIGLGSVAGFGRRAFTPSVLFAAGEQGFWYDPTDIPVNWRRNLLTRTEEFDNAAWTKRGTFTVTANDAIAPDGTLTADKVTGLDTGGNDMFNADYTTVVIAPAGASYAPSIWVKRISTSGVFFVGNPTNTAQGQWNVDLSQLPDAWTRITATTIGVTVVNPFVTSASGTGGIQLRAVSGGPLSMHIWGAQLERGSVATDYQRIVTPEISFLDYQPQPVMYTDSAGTTPVTAVEQAVGLILDKSKGLVLGPELVTNGDFSNGTTGWGTFAGSIAVSGGEATLTANPSAAFPQITQTVSGLTVGRTYLMTGTARRGTTVDNAFISPVSGTSVQTSSTSATALRITFVAAATSVAIGLGIFSGSTNGTAVFDNISVRELAGNHAIQPGATNRPILRSRYNLALQSETLTNAAWAVTRATVAAATGVGLPPGVAAAFKITEDSTASNTHFMLLANDVVVASGGGYRTQIRAKAGERTWLALQEGQGVTATAYFNLATGAVGTVSGTGSPTASISALNDGWYLCTLNWSALGTAARIRAYLATGDGGASYTGDGTSGLYMTGADLRANADTYLPYQRIAAATDYDTVGFPVYLSFDGSDDSLYTGGNVDFSATDKITLWAGVTKLSDAAAAPIIELGPDSGANNGVFAIFAPSGGGVADYYWRSKGTAASNNSVTGNASPSTRVLTAIGDIAADFANLRVDGVDNTKSDDQGTGNFASAVVNIGRRNNASAPFNGRLYSLIGRGAATSAALITQAERWVAGKQGRAL